MFCCKNEFGKNNDTICNLALKKTQRKNWIFLFKNENNF